MQSSKATTRIQFLDYTLIRSGRFNSNELALLNILQSFSSHCEMKQEYLAKAMNKSVSTIQRTIKSLIAKGMIRRTYTTFKRCILVIVTLEIQKTLKSVTGMIQQAFKIAKNKRKKIMKSSHLSPMTELNLSPMTEPTRSETKEIKHINRNTNLVQKTDLKPKPFDLNRAKDEALAKFRAAYL